MCALNPKLARRFIAAVVALGLAGCNLLLREPQVPMQALDLPLSPTARSQTLIVFMPGAQEVPQDIVREGFVDQVRARGIDADVRVVDAHLGYFYNGVFEQRLHDDVVRPARAQGYRSIWMAGISLGGFGALRYARAHPEEVDGIIALAPYVAPRLDLQEVWHAGGLQRWKPHAPPTPSQHERALLLWLKGYADPGHNRPPLYMGYGERDRLQPFKPPLMAGILPPGHLLSAPGDHDWPPWKSMWADALDRVPLPRLAPSATR
jgi:S-formylglutathione hydrolase FrmB